MINGTRAALTMVRPKPEPLYIDTLDGDEKHKISDFIERLQELQKKYGMKSKIYFDAGHNNVSVMVEPSRKK
jgi:hypothetical protein